MSDQEIHHKNVVDIGGKQIEYKVTNGLFDHTLFVAQGHAEELLPSKRTGTAKQDGANVKRDIIKLKKAIIENGPPLFLKSAFDDFKQLNKKAFDGFKQLNPLIKDEVAERTAFAELVGDTADNKGWKEHHSRLWGEFERERAKTREGHRHD